MVKFHFQKRPFSSRQNKIKYAIFIKKFSQIIDRHNMPVSNVMKCYAPFYIFVKGCRKMQQSCSVRSINVNYCPCIPSLTKMLLSKREIDERENYLQRECWATIKFDFMSKEKPIFGRGTFLIRWSNFALMRQIAIPVIT